MEEEHKNKMIEYLTGIFSKNRRWNKKEINAVENGENGSKDKN